MRVEKAVDNICTYTLVAQVHNVEYTSTEASNIVFRICVH